jgi:hypothetical protein
MADLPSAMRDSAQTLAGPMAKIASSGEDKVRQRDG